MIIKIDKLTGKITDLSNKVDELSRDAEQRVQQPEGEACPSCKELKASVKEANPNKYSSHKAKTGRVFPIGS